jgi:hypothetical protein
MIRIILSLIFTLISTPNVFGFSTIELSNGEEISAHPQLSKYHRDIISNNFNKYKKYQLTSTTDEQYLNIFDNTPTSVQDYISKRIKYIIPAHLDFSNFVEFQFKDSKCGVLATNLGAALYQTDFKRVKFGDKSLNITSPSIGIIKLGEDFGKVGCQKSPGHVISTFVHEARHSDCTKGSKHCSHKHSVCPKGHDLEGIKACDAHRWGAYSIQALHLKNLYKNCQNCTEEEKQLQLISLTETISRINIDKEDSNDIWDALGVAPKLREKE